MAVTRWARGRLLERFDAGIFDVRRMESTSATGVHGIFTTIFSRDWAIVVPILGDLEGNQVVMVRQYRHGSDAVFLEFPGGMIEPGEEPAAGVLRELEEETGYRAGRLVNAGSLSPNPAFMENLFHIFVAFELTRTGTIRLDEHEELDVEHISLVDLRSRMGLGELANAMMTAGLFLAERVLLMEGI